MQNNNQHPLLKIIGIYEMLDEHPQDGLGYIMDNIIAYLDDYKCCAFCSARGTHDNCPEDVHDGLDRIEWCDYWHDAREKCNRDFMTEDFYKKFLHNLPVNKEQNP